MFGCSANSVQRWMKQGKIKFEIEDGGGCIKRAKIPETELDWIGSHQTSGRPQGSRNKTHKPKPEPKRKKKELTQNVSQFSGATSQSEAEQGLTIN